MNGASSMLNQLTLWDMPNATSSQVADSGASPCVKLDGPTTGPSGQAQPHAPASARQAKAKGLMILVTSGLLGHDSSASATLQQSLESKLVPRLDTAGSTLFRLIWKHKTTPLGRSYLERQALAHHTSGNGFTSWRSPNARLNGGGDYSDPEKAAKRLEQGHQLNLSEEALIASWPTPQAADVSRVEMDRLKHDRQTRDPNMPGSYRYELPDVARMASWSTPKAEDSECAGAHRGKPDTLHSQANLATWATPANSDYRTANLKSFAERGGGKKGEQLRNQVKQLAGWASPKVNDDNLDRRGMKSTEKEWNRPNASRSSLPLEAKMLAAWPSPCTPNGGRSMSTDKMDVTGKTLDGRKHTTTLEHAVKFAGPVRLTASGEMLTGLDAGMESSGQLNPAHSRWLMGVPPVWDDFASTAMQSASLRHKHSLKRTSKQKAQRNKDK
jgi:hypothetical protein